MADIVKHKEWYSTWIHIVYFARVIQHERDMMLTKSMTPMCIGLMLSNVMILCRKCLGIGILNIMSICKCTLLQLRGEISIARHCNHLVNLWKNVQWDLDNGLTMDKSLHSHMHFYWLVGSKFKIQVHEIVLLLRTTIIFQSPHSFS